VNAQKWGERSKDREWKRDMRASNEAKKSRDRNKLWCSVGIKVKRWKSNKKTGTVMVWRWAGINARNDNIIGKGKTIQFTKKTIETEKIITGYYVIYQTRAGWNSCKDPRQYDINEMEIRNLLACLLHL